MKNIKTFEEFLNEAVNNGSFGDKNQFTWIYDKPFKNLTLQEQGHKSKTRFKELVIKKIEDREVKKLIDEIQYEDYLSWNIIKSIVKKYHPEFQVINESLVILDLKGLMTNEFMNNIELKNDFENARRLLYERVSGIFEHKGSNVFRMRTYTKLTKENLDAVLVDVNQVMVRMKFSRTGDATVTNIKENQWKLSCKLI